MEETATQPQPVQPQATYQPVGVPAVAPSHPGMTQGIFGLVCAVISLLFFPPVFGIAGIVLGVLAMRHGEKALGITALVLSAVFMVVGMAFGVYAHAHPDLFRAGSSATGAVIESLSQ